MHFLTLYCSSFVWHTILLSIELCTVYVVHCVVNRKILHCKHQACSADECEAHVASDGGWFHISISPFPFLSSLLWKAFILSSSFPLCSFNVLSYPGLCSLDHWFPCLVCVAVRVETRESVSVAKPQPLMRHRSLPVWSVGASLVRVKACRKKTPN